jgi:hypothetical protein
VQNVVDDGGDPTLGAGLDEVRDVGFERRVAAFMLSNLCLTDPGDRPVRCGIDAKDDALSCPAGRHPDNGLVPDIANVVVNGWVDEEIVIASRNGRLACAGQRALPPAFVPPNAFAIDREPPEPAERLPLARRRILESEHIETS